MYFFYDKIKFVISPVSTIYIYCLPYCKHHKNRSFPVEISFQLIKKGQPALWEQIISVELNISRLLPPRENHSWSTAKALRDTGSRLLSCFFSFFLFLAYISISDAFWRAWTRSTYLKRAPPHSKTNSSAASQKHNTALGLELMNGE